MISHVMTLANSIIGVSLLAMPYCFKQCGCILATMMLLLCGTLSRLASHFLVKSAVTCRRRNFELLSFHAFGRTGKFVVELLIIGFLLGTCIALFVVVGDLGPEIVGKVIDKHPSEIRTSLLLIIGTFVVLPLGLLKNIDSLSSISIATIGFYFCLILKVVTESTNHIFIGDWLTHVHYWRPAGILQCLPIFSMALFCQTQLFEIYETIPNVSLEKMNQVVRSAINICTMVYVCVGFFGYVAFCTQSFTGNILMSFEPSISSDIIKIGFVTSVAFSFPLVIFPCRASLNSLLFGRAYTHDLVNYIPETRFKWLTMIIIGISLISGILIPNIEFVLGIVGSTMGVMICLIFPTAFFISTSSKNTNERLLAQGILFIGVWIMLLGTYANLYTVGESNYPRLPTTTVKPLNQINNIPLGLIDKHPLIIKNQDVHNRAEEMNRTPKIIPDDTRVTEPQAPIKPIKTVENGKSKEDTVTPSIPKTNIVNEKKVNNLPKDKNVEKIEKTKIAMVDKNNNTKNDNLIHSDAIKKEEIELAAERDLTVDTHEELRKTLEKHKLEQLKMMQEQKKILKDIKEQKKELEEEKLKLAKDNEKLKIPVVPSKEQLNVSKNDIPSVIKSVDNIKTDRKDVDDSKVTREAKSSILNVLVKNKLTPTNVTDSNSIPIALKMKNSSKYEEKIVQRDLLNHEKNKRDLLKLNHSNNEKENVITESHSTSQGSIDSVSKTVNLKVKQRDLKTFASKDRI